jgi:hypothetical protein
MVVEPPAAPAKSRHLLTLTPPPSPPSSPARSASSATPSVAQTTARHPPRAGAARADASGGGRAAVATLEQFGFVARKPGSARAAGHDRRVCAVEARKPDGAATRGGTPRGVDRGGGSEGAAERYCVCQAAYDARRTYIG